MIVVFVIETQKQVEKLEEEKEALKRKFSMGYQSKFFVSEYLSKMERAALDILEHQEPVDQTIILWWGLDGLRLNEDGELEWVSRKKPKLINQNVSYQPCQCITPMPQYTMCQIPQEQIDALEYQNTMLQRQAAQTAQNMMIVNSLAGYYKYSPWMQSPYQSQMTQCCCNVWSP